jgi:hypothetical protein
MYNDPDRYYDQQFMLNFLPAVQHNDGIIEFLKPASSLYGWMVKYGSDLSKLQKWDQVPEQFITHLASNLDFEMLDIPYATIAERRRMLKWIVWLYKHRGTKVGIEQLCELLGFSPIVSEIHPSWVPLVLDFHKSCSIENLRNTGYLIDPMNNLHNFDSPLNLTSWWRIENGKLAATGGGNGSVTNAILTTFDSDVYKMAVDYEVTDTGGYGILFTGMYLKYALYDHYISFIIGPGASEGSDLILQSCISGTLSTFRLYHLTSAEETGNHRLWIYADHTNDIYTGGIDANTRFYLNNSATPTITSDKKGLISRYDCTVLFDNLEISELNYDQANRLYDSSLQSNKVQFALDGAPKFCLSKKRYLDSVMGLYIPFHMELSYVHGNDLIVLMEDRAVEGTTHWDVGTMSTGVSFANKCIAVNCGSNLYCQLGPSTSYFTGFVNGQDYRVTYSCTIDAGGLSFKTGTTQSIGNLEEGEANYLDFTASADSSSIRLYSSAGASNIGNVVNISVMPI